MSYVLSLTQPLIEKYKIDTLDKNERRRSNCGALAAFKMQTKLPGSILTKDNEANIKKSAGNLVKIAVIDKQAVTIGNVRSCTISDNEQTSKLITLNFFTMVSSFTIWKAQFFNNYVGYQDDYDTKLTNMIIEWEKYLDTACRNQLEASKNSYYPSEISAYYPIAGNALQIPQSGKNDAFNQLSSVLNQMDFTAAPQIVASTSLMGQISRLKYQGSQNATNEAFQLNPYNWDWSNRVTNNPGIESTFYAVPNGNLAISNRNMPDNIARTKTALYEWGEVTLPFIDMKVGSYYSQMCADGSSITPDANLTQTNRELFEFSTDICLITAYNSDPSGSYTPIVKGEISQS